jgi:hypothetical protein
MGWSIPADSTCADRSALCGRRGRPCSLCCRGPNKNSRTIAPDQNTAELCAFVIPVEHFQAGQGGFLEIGAIALRAGHVHLVTPNSPLQGGKILSDQLPSSAVVTFLNVVNPKPRPPGLVARLCSRRPRFGHFLNHVQGQLAIPFGSSRRKRSRAHGHSSLNPSLSAICKRFKRATRTIPDQRSSQEMLNKTPLLGAGVVVPPAKELAG